MKPQFKLKEPEAKGKTSIRLVAYVKGERLVYSIGESIDPIYWNSNSQRAIIPRGNKELQDQCRDINVIIERVRASAIKGESELKRLDIPVTSENLKEYLNSELGNAKTNKTVYVVDYLERHIGELTSGAITTDKGNYKKSTITAYNSTLLHLKGYEKKYNVRIRFERLTSEFYNKYKSYLVGESKKPNTIGKDIKNIKVISRIAYDSGIKVNDQVWKFKTIAHLIEVPYLTVEELATIEGLDYSKNPRLDNARDVFIIVCWTGLRYSDIKTLSKENLIKGNTRIKVTMQKTSNPVEIPVFEPVKRIIEKHNGFPRMISNPKLNDYIKDVCTDAEINQPIQVVEMKKGMEVKKYEPKHTQITVHTGRRSFATNLYKSGRVSTRDIMAVTGHKSESAFYRYIRITPEESADRLQEVDISIAPLKKAR